MRPKTGSDSHRAWHLVTVVRLGARAALRVREVTSDGSATITRQNSKPGDYVELLALMDVLAVPNVCGADIMRTSNFSLKPIRLTVYEATDGERARTPRVPVLKSQRTPKDFRNATIKVERELRRDPTYVLEFSNVPLVVEDLPVMLSVEEARQLEAVKLSIYGDDEASALRDILFSWWEERFLSAKSGAPAVGMRDVEQRNGPPASGSG